MNECFKLSIACLLTVNSLVGQELGSNESVDHIVLESILSTSQNESIYYKTIIKDWKTPIASYVKDHLLEFDLCIRDADSASTVISAKEISFLKEEFSKQKVQRIDRILPKYKIKTTKKLERFKTGRISMPVVFRNGTMALYFAVATYSGEFHLLRKRENNWETICSSLVWIE